MNIIYISAVLHDNVLMLEFSFVAIGFPMKQTGRVPVLIADSIMWLQF